MGPEELARLAVLESKMTGVESWVKGIDDKLDTIASRMDKAEGGGRALLIGVSLFSGGAALGLAKLIAFLTSIPK